MPYIRSRTLPSSRVPRGTPQWNPRFPRPVLVWTPYLNDLVSGIGFSQVAPSTLDVLTANDAGVVRKFNGGTVYTLPLTAITYFAPPATVLVVWREAVNAIQPFFSFGGAGSGFGWVVSATTSAYRMTYGGVADYTSSVTYDRNRTNVVAFSIGPPTTNFDLIENGIYRGTTAAGGSPSGPAAKATIAGANEGTSTICQCYLGLVAAWNSQLPRGMLCELTSAPYQLFRPERNRVAYFAAAGPAFNPAWARAANSVIQPGAMAA